MLSGLDERTAPPGGPWGQPVDTALVLPLEAPGQGLLGVLVAGKSPNRALDESYRSFYELLRGQVGLAIRNAAAIEDERRRSEALAELDRAKTTFFSNISHEFRTPLTLILGPVEDALERGGGSLSGADLFAVHASSLRLLRLVNNLLEFSRLEAGHVPSVLEPVDLALLTLDLASSFRSLVERAGLGFVVDCPPLSRPVPIDRTQWEKVVLNLLSNAFKFTFQGQIRLSLTERGDRAELVVEDTGAGIPEHELPRIFERFHRVQGAHGRSMEGTGIGLSLVAELVRHRGGQVRAESVAGAGSTFTVSIPLALPPLLQTSPARAEAERGAETGSGAAASFVYVREAESWLPPEQRRALPEGLLADEQDEPPARAPRRPGAAEKPARVLIVDDNGDLRGYLARLLEKHWQVDAAEDGVAALELARRARPDVVISDVMMPRLDGIGLLRALRREPLTATVPVILLSARAGEESVVEGLETGADDYLVKPFSARELLSRVRTQLTLSRMRRAVAEAEERERGHSVLQFLAHASAAAAESLDYQATLARVTRLAVPILADWCFIDLLTEEGEVVRVEVAHADPADAELALQLKAFPASLRGNRDNPPVRTLVEGRPVLVEALDPELMRSLAHNDAHFSVMQRVNARSFMSVPLVARGRRIGSLSLATSVSGRRYGPRDVTVAEDLARRCALAVDNARLYQEAQAAIAARDRFLSIASHELRTPLTPLQLSLHSLERRAPAIVEDEQSREWLQDKLRLLRRQAERIDRLVTELLDVTRITNDQLRLSPEPAELSEIAREVLDRFEQTGELARSGCEVELSAASPVCGHWDRLRIDQVLTNLLENALKFGEKKPIRVAIERRGARALVAVSDRGLGIAPADQSRIFERFERAVPEQHYGGLGLGLWIVRRIVEAMGGSIHVESRPDQGATFEVELPLGGAPGAPTT